MRKIMGFTPWGLRIYSWSMRNSVILTGIKPTGMPHLGNYLGAIRPALAMADEKNVEARFFIADYHSLNAIRDARLLRSYTYEVAAVWLACGLNPSKILLYRQSDLPEIFEMTTILMAFTAKGLMNRAHAYKAAVDSNRSKNLSDDNGINMGVFTYPVLMAADILLLDTDYVPVGKDQAQHIEMTQDIAGAVNHNYKRNLLVIPKARIDEKSMSVPGLDGRKMSKSYNNHIPLFAPETQLKKTVMRIVTNSQGVEEPKNPEECNVFALFRLLASEAEERSLADRYRRGGMGWGEAKRALFALLNSKIAPMRARYDRLMSDTSSIDVILAEGSKRARLIAANTIRRLRQAIGVD